MSINFPWKRAWRDRNTHKDRSLVAQRKACQLIFRFAITRDIKKREFKTNHGNEASYELEVLEVVGVDVGCRVDLETVVIFPGVFKQAVHGVQNFMRQQEEPLPARQRTTEMRKWDTFQRHPVKKKETNNPPKETFAVGKRNIAGWFTKLWRIQIIIDEEPKQIKHKMYEKWFYTFLLTYLATPP